MDEKTIGILLMGGLVVALGVFGSFMAARQQEQEKLKAKAQPRQLRPSQRVRLGIQRR